MRYNDKGDAVLTVQHQLLQRGYSLPKYGADGHLGDETWGALELYAKTEVGRSSWNPEVPELVLERLAPRLFLLHLSPLLLGRTRWWRR